MNFKYMIARKTILISLATLIIFGLVSAQPVDKTEESINVFDEKYAEPEQTPDNVDCFEMYKFGSVQTNLTPSVSEVASGVPVSFSGNIVNSNNYPIVDGSLYVKVFRNSKSVNDGNGPDVVDQFLIKENIAIKANGSYPVSFSWKVPTHALSGDYKLVTFVTSGKKFNLSGLSFTDDVVGNSVSFVVNGEQDASVKFDKSSVKVADKKYFFASFPPRVQKNSPIKISVNVENTKDENEEVTVRWEIYQWDAMLSTNQVQKTITETHSINAKSKQTLSTTVTDTKYPVYYVVGTLEWKDTKSVIGVRFVREGVDKPRINFPSILSYPLKSGEENTIFSCIHNSGLSSNVKNNKLELTLVDGAGNNIHTFSHEGDISGRMMAVADKFTPKEDVNSFRVNAKLYSENVLVDEVKLTYDCKDLSSADCSRPLLNNLSTTENVISSLDPLYLYILIVLFLVLVALAIARLKGLLILLVFVNLFPDSYTYAEWLGTRWSNNSMPVVCVGPMCKRVWYSGLSATVDYNIDIRNARTGQPIACNTKVAAGTEVIFSFREHKFEDIFWFRSGGPTDSPYGEWNPDATINETRDNPSNLCTPNNLTNGEMNGSGYSYYAAFSVGPPNKSFAGLPGTCENISPTERKCILSGGDYDIKFNFSPTKAKIYGAYQIGGKCTAYGQYSTRGRLWEVDIEANTVSCKISAGAVTGQQPTPPILVDLNKDQICGVSQLQSINMTSTDPDGDMVQYLIDWDNNGSVDQIFPESSYVNSGSTQTVTKQFVTSGIKTVRVMSVDTKGNSSDWRTINLNKDCKLQCSITNICNQTIPGYIDNDKCVPTSGENSDINASCISFFWCSADAVSPNGGIECGWKTPTSTSVKCGFVDLTTPTPRPIPGLQNLDSNVDKIRINNIQKTTRFCLICNFYNLKSGALLGEAVKHQWVRVLRVGEN